MKRRIWKYEAQVGPFEREMPKDAEVISVGIQFGKIVFWAIVQPDTPAEIRKFYLAGTGHPLPADTRASDFRGTVQIDGFVFHLFDAPEQKQ